MDAKKIIEIINEHNGIITLEEAEEYSISRTALFRLKEKGVITALSRGIYGLIDEVPDMMYIIQNRCKGGVFSHESALYFHQLTDRTPLSHVMTVATSYKTTSFKDLPLKFRYIKSELVTLGKIEVDTNYGNTVYTYDIDRTICDIIRNKNQLDTSIVNEALKAYAKDPQHNYAHLMQYAQKFGIEKKVRLVMEVLF